MAYIPSDKLCAEKRENVRGGVGTITFEHLYEDASKLPEKCRLYAKMTVPAGCSLGEHAHVDETEFYYVLRGEGIITDGGQRIRVSEGDVIATGGGASHGVENRSDEDLVILATIVLD
ncbi:MAG: cupin domain-containing protein [Christensenellales bacterium]|jgi:mannose-6-phosphate isomerase-like protein (cupin superfamily)